MSIRAVALYARLSVTRDESVSIQRQLASAREYAERKGWTVVLEAVDDGVSATKNKPEDREGWQSVLQSDLSFQAVIIWKVDRLARKTLDFLHANEALEKRGAALVAVEEQLDLTTAQGKAFATILATFGEAEAASMSARATAARKALLANGRRAGGRPPFGYMNIPNPAGAGMVLAQDPATIEAVKEAAKRAAAGDSLYSIARYWEDTGVKHRANANRKHDNWRDASVDAILRNPVLAGMTPYTRGKRPGDDMPTDVLRGEDGLPMIDASLAIMSPSEHREMLAKLDAAKKPGSRPRADASLLYGIIRCGTCESFLYRATGNGEAYLRCQSKTCDARVSVSRPVIEEYIRKSVIAYCGSIRVLHIERDPNASAVQLDEIEMAIADTLNQLGYAEGEQEEELTARLRNLKEARRSAKTVVPKTTYYSVGETYDEVLTNAPVEEQRAALLDLIDSINVNPSTKAGGRFDKNRVDILWNQDAELFNAAMM